MVQEGRSGGDTKNHNRSSLGEGRYPDHGSRPRCPPSSNSSPSRACRDLIVQLIHIRRKSEEEMGGDVPNHHLGGLFSKSNGLER